MSILKRNKFYYRNMVTAYLMLAPAIIMLGIFVFTPLGMAINRSFVSSTTGEFAFFDNFHYIIKIDNYLGTFLNVLVLSIIITISVVLLSFLFANVLKNLSKRFGAAIKIIIFLPYLLSGIVTSIAFLLMLNYGGGLFVSILYKFDLPAIAFDKEGLWPYFWIIVPTVWMGFGYNALVMYAGLLSIPKSYYEAAEIDGANSFEKLIYITIPNMKNYFVLLLINLTTAGLQMFEVPMMITGGGPLDKTMTPILFLYNKFNSSGDSDNSVIAGALMMMVVISVINFFVFKIVRSEKSQDA